MLRSSRSWAGPCSSTSWRTEHVGISSQSARPDPGTLAAAAAAVLMGAALALIFFSVPTDVDQGYSQRIFYFHVPIAMTTYVLFAWSAVNAVRYLLSRDRSLDMKSYVPMHLGVIFGSLTLVTGAVSAKASWGVWWYWGSTQLNTFLIIFLFYCAYFMLRFSVEDGEKRATYSAVYALLGVGLIPVSVLAVRVSQELIHPTTFNRNGANMDGSMFLTFLVSLAARLALAVSMYFVEMRGKRLDERVRRIRRLAEAARGSTRPPSSTGQPSTASLGWWRSPTSPSSRPSWAAWSGSSTRSQASW